jgi:hypothetical protein
LRPGFPAEIQALRLMRIDPAAKADKAITEGTTSSWEALNYFALGESKWQEGKTGGFVEGDSLALILVLLKAGEAETAEKLASEVRESVGKRSESAPMRTSDMFVMGQLEALLGRSDLAVANVRKSLEAGYRDFFFPTILPGFQSVRDDPDFRAIFGLSK